MLHILLISQAGQCLFESTTCDNSTLIHEEIQTTASDVDATTPKAFFESPETLAAAVSLMTTDSPSITVTAVPMSSADPPSITVTPFVVECVRDCTARADGNYQSCFTCNGFIQCLFGYLFEQTCQNLFWDQSVSKMINNGLNLTIVV